ncbi:MAG: DUF1415 family protein [Bradymonadia bacterium]
MTPTQDMKTWIQNIVVGENLCPFAKNQKNIPEIFEVSLNDLEHEIPKAIHRVLDSEYSENNVLIIITNGLESFDDFWAVCCALEENLEQSGLLDAVQLAHFHPEYRFSGLSDHDRANWTNRSPFPALHFLCATTVEDGIANFPGASDIPSRNVEHIRAMSDADFKRLFGTE